MAQQVSAPLRRRFSLPGHQSSQDHCIVPCSPQHCSHQLWTVAYFIPLHVIWRQIHRDACICPCHDESKPWTQVRLSTRYSTKNSRLGDRRTSCIALDSDQQPHEAAANRTRCWDWTPPPRRAQVSTFTSHDQEQRGRTRARRGRTRRACCQCLRWVETFVDLFDRVLSDILPLY